ncbi:unnamed protein product [Cylindrotheca closterium]|uniref:Uncharacterized protein n=1 Tax=Cylindrotheca closterium TaxID=2856 RepID=A0AAD2CSA2_9STRA|nr:unnamed protein product [Cylindrotheca closterium]
MANWQVQLDAVSAAKEDVSVASTQSSNVQVGREVAVMHSQAHRGLRYKDSGNLVYLDSNDYKDGKIPEHFDTHDPKWFCLGETGPSLDTGLTFHLRKDSMNANMGTLKELPYMFNYGTNVGGGRNLTHEVESKHMDNMCKYDADVICDVDSASLLVKEGYRIVMDTDVENAFFVSKDGNQWIYREKDGLYTYEPHEGESHCNVCMEIGPTGEACRSCRAHGGFVPGESYHGCIDNTTSQHTSRSQTQTSRQILQIYTSTMSIRSVARVTALSLLWKFTSAQFCTSLKTDTWAGYVDAVSEALDQTGFAVLCPFEISGDGCQGMEEYPEGLRIKEGQSQVLISCDSLLFGYHEESTECVVDCPGRHITVPESSSLTLERYSGLQTVKKNIEGYTPQQVDRANAARSGYHMGGAPGIEAFKVAVRSGLFKNCPIREEDIVIADKIYGPSASVLKGKTKHPTPEAVRDVWVEIPCELLVHNIDLKLHLDIAFINNTFGLTTIYGSIRYRTFVPL